MLAYILGIIKWSYKGIGKRGKLSGFQIGVKRFHIRAGITNRGNRDYKPGRDFKSGLVLQIGAKQPQYC